MSQLSAQSHFTNDLGLDSLDTVEVVMAIEEVRHMRRLIQMDPQTHTQYRSSALRSPTRRPMPFTAVCCLKTLGYPDRC